MKSSLKQDLYRELLAIESEVDLHGGAGGDGARLGSRAREMLVHMAADVGESLRQRPYATGKSIATEMGLSREVLTIIYKMLQRSRASQERLRESNNRDYFKVVKHYFDNDFFTLVLFVGTSCPSRCVYCPNVRTDKIGRRRLVTYVGAKEDRVTTETLNQVFEELSAFKSSGTDILVKISGGLEPLTDLPTMKAIMQFALQKEIPVKLFTNGQLLADPDKRRVALSTGDIRISLSTTDEQRYREICVSKSNRRARTNPLGQLRDSIRKLVEERPGIHPDCKIGFNCVVMPENHEYLVALIDLAGELGIDYVEFKPDYFSQHDTSAAAAMEASLDEARHAASRRCRAGLYVNFAGSLSADDLYWHPWSGTCDALRQSDFKLFVSPFGHCSPVHYGAFPHSSVGFKNSLSRYAIGKIGPRRGLHDVLSNPAKVPEIELAKLNPFELMLQLEIDRTDQDGVWGLPQGVSPYLTRRRAEMPAQLRNALESLERNNLS